MYGFIKLLQPTSTLQPKKWSRKMCQQLKCYKHEETRVWIPRHINYMCGSPSLIQPQKAGTGVPQRKLATDKTSHIGKLWV